MLKATGGLEKFVKDGRMKPINEEDLKYWQSEVEPGWSGLLKDLYDKLEPLVNDPDYPHDPDFPFRVTQVKEKFGGLRFYVNQATDEVNNYIDLAEKKSYTICEFCGEPGSANRDLGWVKTVCDKHYMERKVREMGRSKDIQDIPDMDVDEITQLLNQTKDNLEKHFGVNDE